MTAEAVNVRAGPSTGHGIEGRITQGDIVEVLALDPSGWARIRIEGDGVEGWVASRFLDPLGPDG